MFLFFLFFFSSSSIQEQKENSPYPFLRREWDKKTAVSSESIMNEKMYVW